MNDFKNNDRFGGKRRGGFGGKPGFQRSGGFSRPQGQMFPAVCAQCGKSTEVPFKPNGQRPIYCRDCYGGSTTSTNEAPRRPYQAPAQFQPRPQAPVADPRIEAMQYQLVKIHAKLDEILMKMAVAKAQQTIEPQITAKPKAPKKKAAKK
jgi:CxxC-x17-CxxC domain-containing protein